MQAEGVEARQQYRVVVELLAVGTPQLFLHNNNSHRKCEKNNDRRNAEGGDARARPSNSTLCRTNNTASRLPTVH